MRGLLPAIILIIGASVAWAEFTDYRLLSSGQSPEQFEKTVTFENLYPNSAVIFTIGHELMWEARNVKDYIVQDDKITAILKDNTVFLEQNACGGLIVPGNTGSITYKNNYLVASSPENHSVYSVTDCAQYYSLPRRGYIDVNDSYLCETTDEGYIIRDLYSGAAVSTHVSDRRFMAVYASRQACYFIDEDALVLVSDMLSYPRAITHAGENVVSADKTKAGISAVTQRGGFDVTVYDTGAVGVDFYDSELPLPLIAKDADKYTETSAMLLVLKYDVLSAYDRADSWQKMLVTLFREPDACVYGDDVYITDIFGKQWKLNDGRLEESSVPGGCEYDGIYYDNGVFFAGNKPLYEFASLILQQGGKFLYKYEAGGETVYFYITD